MLRRMAPPILHRALLHHRAGDVVAAIPLYRRVLAADPRNADAHHLLGLALHQNGALAEARDALETAHGLHPTEPLYATTLGRLHLEAHRPDAAEAVLRPTCGLHPDDTGLGAALALAVAHQGRHAEAEPLLRAALCHAPEDRELAGALGLVLRGTGRAVTAIPLLERAAGTADGLSNLALALSDAGRLPEAIAACAAALALEPLHADAAYNQATALLLAGRYRAAWPGFERRWQRRGHQPPFPHPSPRWQGEPTTGRLLLHAEQGLGDTIQMARFLPALAARHRLLVAVPRTLLDLLRPLAPGATWHALEDRLPGADLHCPLMSLPSVLNIGLADIPGAPYLTAAPLPRVAALPGPRIGMTWAGNPAYPADAGRSLPVEALAPLCRIPGITLISLQKDAAAPPGMLDWSAELGDMAATAAVVAGLDLVISVDTAVAHLAGALGRPVWLLNRHAPCWRWMLNRADSPWYPTLHQFRQPAPGDWGSVIAAVVQKLSTAWDRSTSISTSTPSPAPDGTCTTPPPARSTSGTMSRTSA